MHDFQAVGVQALNKVFAACIGLGVDEQAVVHADFGGQAVGDADPGDHALDLDAVGTGGAALGVGDEFGVHFGDTAVGIFDGTGAGDDMAVFKADFVAGEQAEEALGRGFFIVAAFDPHLFADLEAALAQLGQVGVDGGAARVEVASAHHGIPVSQHQLDGVEHGHGAGAVWSSVSRRQPSRVL